MSVANPVLRQSDEQRKHDRAVRKLAEARFGLPEWEINLNLEGRADERPDIIALSGGSVVAIGEVETEATVCRQEAEQWKALAESSPRFYLYVPEGTEGVAAKLIEECEVHCAGLRSYSYSNGDLSVRAVSCKNGKCPPDDHPWWQRIGRGRVVS